MNRKQLAKNCTTWLESIHMHPFDHSVGLVQTSPGKFTASVLVTEDIDEVIHMLVREQDFFLWRDVRSGTRGRKLRGFVEFVRHGKQHIVAEVHPTTGGTWLTLSELAYPQNSQGKS